MIQLTLTLKMATAQVVEMSFTINNSPIQGYAHPDDYTQPTWFSILLYIEKLPLTIFVSDLSALIK